MASILLLLTTLSVNAEPVTPVGNEFQVNTYTTGSQRVARTAAAEDGSFIVVWTSSDALADPGTDSIQAQRYVSDGSPVGGQFQVNSYTTGRQFGGVVAIAPSGIFLAAWRSEGAPPDHDPANDAIRARIFRANGTATGPDFQISTPSSRPEGPPTAAALPSGEFIVAWEVRTRTGFVLNGQRLDAGGDPTASEFEIAPPSSYSLRSQRIAVGPEGEFLVVWERVSNGPGGLPPIITAWGRRYDPAGLEIGTEFQIDLPQDDFDPVFAEAPDAFFQADGGFVVVWAEDASIVGQRFAPDGSKQGNSFPIGPSGNTSFPFASADPGGDGFVIWTSGVSGGDDDDGSSVQGRRLSSEGQGLGPVFQVNTSTVGNQFLGNLAINSDGKALVIWSSESSAGTDTEPFSVQGQFFDLPDLTIFADGFESGNTSSWTATLP